MDIYIKKLFNYSSILLSSLLINMIGSSVLASNINDHYKDMESIKQNLCKQTKKNPTMRCDDEKVNRPNVSEYFNWVFGTTPVPDNPSKSVCYTSKELIDRYDQIITDHGFSYAFNDERMREVVKILHQQCNDWKTGKKPKSLSSFTELTQKYNRDEVVFDDYLQKIVDSTILVKKKYLWANSKRDIDGFEDVTALVPAINEEIGASASLSASLISYLAYQNVQKEIQEKQEKIKTISLTKLTKPVVEKDEFEKADEYEARKNAVLSKYENDVTEQEASYNTQRGKLKAEIDTLEEHISQNIHDQVPAITLRLIGTPSVADIKYSADNEAFLLTIAGSGGPNFTLEATLPMGLEEAKISKDALTNSSPFVVLYMAKGQLVIDKVVLLEKTGIILPAIKFHTLQVNSYSLQSETFTPVIALEHAVKTEIKAAQATKEEADAKAYEQVRYQEAKNQRTKQIALDRKNWPAGAVARLSRDSLLCSSYKSIYKAWAIRRSNNSYMSYPDECLETSDDGYVISLNHMQGGMAKVRMYGATMSGYALSSDIEDK